MHWVLIILLLMTAGDVTARGDDPLADAEGLVRLKVHEAWRGAAGDDMPGLIRNRPNTLAHVIGPDLERRGLLLLKFTDAQEIVPSLQVGIHSPGGLPMDDSSLDVLERNLEKIYTDRIGAPFRVFTLERAEVNGLQSYRLTGVYPWRTNNIRIEQHLVPGTGHLYSITYTAREREFRDHMAEVEQMLASFSIADPPMFTGAVGELIRAVILIAIIGGIVLGIFWVNSIKPQEGSRFSILGWMRRSITGDDRSGPGNPFMRK